jgi:hypothetical protein
MNLSEIKAKLDGIDWVEFRKAIAVGAVKFLRDLVIAKNEILDNFQELEDDVAINVFDWVKHKSEPSEEMNIPAIYYHPFPRYQYIPDKLESSDELLPSDDLDKLSTRHPNPFSADKIPTPQERAALESISENYLNESEDA